jgi:hypothetical protein
MGLGDGAPGVPAQPHGNSMSKIAAALKENYRDAVCSAGEAE